MIIGTAASASASLRRVSVQLGACLMMLCAAVVCGAPGLATLAFGQEHKQPAAGPAASPLSREDDAFLEELTRRAFQFFWDASDPNTGITREHLYWNGSPYPIEKRDVGSTGATGFAITALCIAADRDWVPREKARQRALNTVRYYAERAPNEHGWFYHWLNVINGHRTGANFDSATLPLPKAFTGAGVKSEVSVS